MAKKKQPKLVCVITGDIVNSQRIEPKVWLKILRQALNKYGVQPRQWEVFRGDSFQLETRPEDGLKAVLYIRTCMKRHRPLDARLAIGIGERTHKAGKITESNGPAFVNSGKCFEELKDNHFGIRSPWPAIDKEYGVILNLLSFIMDSWTKNQVELVKLALEYPDATQAELAKKLGTQQSNVSRNLKVTGFYDFIKAIESYKFSISQMT